MKIEVPKILEEIELGEYAPALAGQQVLVWANPDRPTRDAYTKATDNYLRQLLVMDTQWQSRAKVVRRSKATKKAADAEMEAYQAQRAALKKVLNDEILAWWAGIWSQGDDPSTHWVLDELQSLDETDPTFLLFLISKSDTMQKEHQAKQKKA